MMFNIRRNLLLDVDRVYGKYTTSTPTAAKSRSSDCLSPFRASRRPKRTSNRSRGQISSLSFFISRECRIDEANAADDFEALCERDDGDDAFMCDQHLLRHDAGDQEIALLLGSTKQIEVTYVNRSKAPGA